eukprot:TRINITY_DN3232_c0_g1_i1.p1 TRINITY_DN3232_c0_g1~~TRINITY_DN3232_c0_g1_i1.p1  ORF type:complete len:643 (-),score=202.69 TRINITY_DN3232_c0_g1_i1:329-2188(-)
MGKTTLRVGGVPEHFNGPFHLAKERGLYEAAGLDFEWETYHGGTGAMAAGLKEDKIDVAMMLSEGAVAQVASGEPFRLCGTYVATPLTWGVHVKKGSALRSIKDLKGKTFGVSREGSGSHLMSFVMAQQEGWTDLENDVKIKVVNSLDGAREAMKKGEIDVWLWEKFTTKFIVDSGEWERIGEVPTPWPCFLFVATEKALDTKKEAIKKLIDVTRGMCEEFKANIDDKTLEYVRTHHKLGYEDARLWLDGVAWLCKTEVEPTTLEKTLASLKVMKKVPEAVKAEKDKFLAAGLCELRMQQEMPDGMYSWRVKALEKWIEDHKAANGGKNPTMEDLTKAGHLDQYHYLGLHACDEAINLLRLTKSDYVLDVGSGIGGPARYISWKSGCKIHGVDLQDDLVEMGQKVTQIVGLKDQCHFTCEDASDLVGASERYDCFMSLLVILHIPEAPRLRLFKALFDQLKIDGRFLIEDMVCRNKAGSFSETQRKSLHDAVGASFVPSEVRYRAHLESVGFTNLEFESLDHEWTKWAVERHRQYAATKEKQIKEHGEETFRKREGFYKSIADLFQSGELGGVRITGQRPTPGCLKLHEGRRAVRDAKKTLEAFGSIIEVSTAKKQKLN